MNEHQPLAGASTPSESQERIEQLRRRLRQAAGGHLIEGASADCPPDLREQFLQRVLEFEQLPRIPLRSILIERAAELHDPAGLTDAEITTHLWGLIRALADARVFLECTDHLNDRDLYLFLWNEVLPAEDLYFPHDPNFACYFDPIGSGSEADTHLYLKHYADAFWRQSWADEFPDDPIPEHEPPPYSRDRHLPRPERPPHPEHQ